MAEKQPYVLIYEKDGKIYGSRDRFPGNDEEVLERAVLEGEEDPKPNAEGSVEITENGEHDVAAYATAEVNVPGATELDNIDITENGVVDVAKYAHATVNVPSDLDAIMQESF